MNRNVWHLAGATVLVGAFVWAYWPTLVSLVAAWNSQPDYSHGFLVVPLSLLFIWARRDSFPGMSPRLSWLGLALVALSVGLRVFSAYYYLEPIDGWSIMLWVAGAVWFLAGSQVMWWSLPGILFLGFMVPLPYALETSLSRPLQIAATRASCWVLQCLGQPALAEGNTILLGDLPLEVEQACSGLRIFMSIVFLAFGYVVFVRRDWWEKGLLLASIAPVALVANVTRIVVTGLLFQHFPTADAQKLIHDYVGYAMIIYAFALFALVLWCMGKLVKTVEVADVGELARQQRARFSRYMHRQGAIPAASSVNFPGSGGSSSWLQETFQRS